MFFGTCRPQRARARCVYPDDGGGVGREQFATGASSLGTYCQVKWPSSEVTPSLLGSDRPAFASTIQPYVRHSHYEWTNPNGLIVKTGVTTGPLVEVFGSLTSGDQIAARGMTNCGLEPKWCKGDKISS
jgi:hypothetical protein